MKKAFGNLSGIPVYKVCNFHPEIARQGFIQLIDDGSRYWKICTNAPIADGIYDSMTGNTSIYDQSEFNMGIRELKENAKRYKEKQKEEEKIKVEVQSIFEDDMCLKDIGNIIDEILGKAQNSCDDLLSLTEEIKG